MERYEIINQYIKKFKYKTYLEIGVQHGNCLKTVDVEHKRGVDPDMKSPATFHMSSDDYFELHDDKFDFIFIDGLHHADQVYRDVQNALNHLNPGGTIMCHDLMPISKFSQLIPHTSQCEWMGNCWEAWVQLRQELTDYNMYVLDTDCGCGIIREGENDLLSINCDVNYETFDKNRKEWLNLITIEEHAIYIHKDS